MYFNSPLIDKDKVRKMFLNLDVSKYTDLDDLGPRFFKLAAPVSSTLSFCICLYCK